MKRLTSVQFPTPKNININMMPIVMGDPTSLPPELKGYLPLINQCKFEPGSTVYLTVTESKVKAGQSQRRGGIHTEASHSSGWGGGVWGSQEGVYMASTDGACRVWNCETHNVGDQGQVLQDLSKVSSYKMNPNTLYWMTDRTPHEALPSQKPYRQYFRLVSPKIGIWYAKHSTPNPYGIVPKCPVSYENKFDK
jgi:hypothetical protein